MCKRVKMMSRISGKNIILGVTGGIAAYKSCELVRRLIKEEATVRVIMTKNAAEFVTPLTFQALSLNRVATEIYDIEWESEIGHISLADSADLIIVAPATATFIGKAASGIADNLLNAVILATKSPVIVCPVMNVNMYNNPAVQENIEGLHRRGFVIVEPDEGELACGWEGKGRYPDIGVILQEIEKVFSRKDFTGKRIMVTAGATREYIDSVRFISNPSTGKMGYALAKEAWLRGADVLLISGKTDVSPPTGVDIVNALTASDMYQEVMDHLDWADIIVKAAAVGDFTPSNIIQGKIKKSKKDLTLTLKPTKDILLEIGKRKDGKIIVGFAAECENIIENSKEKLKGKNADLIVANDISKAGSGFGQDTNAAYFVDRSGKVEELPLMSKSDLANRVFDKILEIRANIHS
jgi:phosphopantothenoylcysteine decarboxylase/phosphopantothenate--cysteine ligase